MVAGRDGEAVGVVPAGNYPLSDGELKAHVGG